MSTFSREYIDILKKGLSSSKREERITALNEIEDVVEEILDLLEKIARTNDEEEAHLAVLAISKGIEKDSDLSERAKKFLKEIYDNMNSTKLVRAQALLGSAKLGASWAKEVAKSALYMNDPFWQEVGIRSLIFFEDAEDEFIKYLLECYFFEENILLVINYFVEKRSAKSVFFLKEVAIDRYKPLNVRKAATEALAALYPSALVEVLKKLDKTDPLSPFVKDYVEWLMEN